VRVAEGVAASVRQHRVRDVDRQRAVQGDDAVIGPSSGRSGR